MHKALKNIADATSIHNYNLIIKQTDCTITLTEIFIIFSYEKVVMINEMYYNISI